MDPLSISLTVTMLVIVIAALLSGFPVAFALGGGALLAGVVAILSGGLDLNFLLFLPNRLFENVVRNELLFAVPLFITMGVILEKSRVAEDLLEALGTLFGPLRGGLAIAVTIVGALLAASTGIVGAAVVTMGLLSLPTMLKRGYDASFAAGSIAASGTLGQIIPPSIVLILLAEVMSSAWQSAQIEKGNFAPLPMTPGDLFAGALVPGLLLVAVYIVYQAVFSMLRPSAAPPIARRTDGQQGTEPGSDHLGLSFWLRLAGILVPPLLLIIAVLGSILVGIATPTEAASVGAIGATFLGAARQSKRARAIAMLGAAAIIAAFLSVEFTGGPGTGGWIAGGLLIVGSLGLAHALFTLWREGSLRPSLVDTVHLTSMVYAILIGAALFALVFRGIGGDEIVEATLLSLPGGSLGILLAVMLLMFLLGFFLDFIEITFVVVPVIAPILLALDGMHGPIWLGVLMAMNLQTSFLTPPFGFALFYLRGVAPPDVKTSAIYKGVLPFIGLQIAVLAAIIIWPELVTWLPAQLAAD